MTFDLEKAREAVHILENFAFASGKITTGQIQDILWGARLLAGASTEIEQLREANTNFACQACDQAQEIERQATRIQELEDALMEKQTALMPSAPSCYAEARRRAAINQLRAEGKIGSDGSKKISHLRPYEVIAADLANMMAKSWQITDERKAAIRKSAELFEEDASELEGEEYSGAYTARQKSLEIAAVLRAMLQEAGQ